MEATPGTHTTDPPARARLAGLDGLRAVAALGVLALHVAMYTARPHAPWDVGDGLLKGLRLGVVLFFVLSGFLLVRPWLAASRREGDPPRTGAYLLRRAARVLPAYYAALAIGALALIGTGSSRMAEPRDLPFLLLLRQNLSAVAQDKLVPPAWTLCVEAAFYVLLPLAGAALMRWGTSLRRRLGLCALVVIGSVGFNALVESGLPYQWHRTLAAGAYAFAFGIAAAAIVSERPPSRPVRTGLIVLGWALVVADALAHVPLALPGHDVWWDVPAGAGFAAVVAAAATGPALVLGSGPLRTLGHRSYGLYLVHYPVLLALTWRGALPRAPLPALAVVVAGSLVIAELLLRGIERPAMRGVRRLEAAGARRGRHREPRLRLRPQESQAGG